MAQPDIKIMNGKAAILGKYRKNAEKRFKNETITPLRLANDQVMIMFGQLNSFSLPNTNAAPIYPHVCVRMCKVSRTASAQHMQTSRNPKWSGPERSPGHWAHCGCSPGLTFRSGFWFRPRAARCPCCCQYFLRYLEAELSSFAGVFGWTRISSGKYEWLCVQIAVEKRLENS